MSLHGNFWSTSQMRIEERDIWRSAGASAKCCTEDETIQLHIPTRNILTHTHTHFNTPNETLRYVMSHDNQDDTYKQECVNYIQHQNRRITLHIKPKQNAAIRPTTLLNRFCFNANCPFNSLSEGQFG